MTEAERPGPMNRSSARATAILVAALVLGLLVGADTGAWVFLTVGAVLLVALAENTSHLAPGRSTGAHPGR